MDSSSQAIFERAGELKDQSTVAHSPKACQSCTRIEIGRPFQAVSRARVFFGLFFVYAPIVLLPVFVLSALLVYAHLRLMGAQNLKTLRDFLPEWQSHATATKPRSQFEMGRGSPFGAACGPSGCSTAPSTAP